MIIFEKLKIKIFLNKINSIQYLDHLNSNLIERVYIIQ
jgi:hypothetical protein